MIAPSQRVFIKKISGCHRTMTKEEMGFWLMGTSCCSLAYGGNSAWLTALESQMLETFPDEDVTLPAPQPLLSKDLRSIGPIPPKREVSVAPHPNSLNRSSMQSLRLSAHLQSELYTGVWLGKQSWHACIPVGKETGMWILTCGRGRTHNVNFH